MTAALDRARRLADDVLLPAANQVDRSGLLPAAPLDQITEAGLYGLVGPAELGGVGADRATQLEIIETLASGCLTTCLYGCSTRMRLGWPLNPTVNFMRGGRPRWPKAG